MTARLEFWRSWSLPNTPMTFRRWHDGQCAMCGNGTLVLDHCHDTGIVRGYLCRACNRQECEGGPRWQAWRSGDHPAAAFGHFEIYQNMYGTTPISPYSALVYYTASEAEAWWASVEASVALGVAWPSSTPWSEVATARRDAEWASLSSAIAGLEPTA